MIPAEAADAISSAASDDPVGPRSRGERDRCDESPPDGADRRAQQGRGRRARWLGALGSDNAEHLADGRRTPAAGCPRRRTRLLHRVLTAGAALAERYAGTAMAGRTHGQHAVPITFGYKVAVWLDALVRQDRRLVGLEEDVFTSMAGGAVGNFAAMGPAGPEVHRRMARHLGLVPCGCRRARGARSRHVRAWRCSQRGRHHRAGHLDADEAGVGEVSEPCGTARSAAPRCRRSGTRS